MNAKLNDLQFELWLRKRNSGELRWTTKNGDEIPIKDMSDAHIANAINHIRKVEETIEESSYYPSFERYGDEGDDD